MKAIIQKVFDAFKSFFFHLRVAVVLHIGRERENASNRSDEDSDRKEDV